MYKPPRAIYKLVRSATVSGTSEGGHKYRTRNAIFDGDIRFDRHKYGKKSRKVARKAHDVAYNAKRVKKLRKKPAAR